MKKVLKLTIGIKGDDPEMPVFMEDEEPGVFATQVIEVDVPEGTGSHGMFAKWMLDKEKDIVKDSIELKWHEAVEDEI